MLYRKFEKYIREFLRNETDKILLVNGARQIGKTYLIRHVGKEMYQNYVEINLKEDYEGAGLFAKVRSTADFYLQLGAMAGQHLGTKSNTLVFLDEIQSYPHMLTMLKFLNQEGKYTYIASGSQLGVALSQTASVPIGSIAIAEMYPLDFEEFLLAMGCAATTIDAVGDGFRRKQALNEPLHNYMLRQFRLYLLVGGLPEAVNKFLENRNISHVRKVQGDIHALYRIDASQYDAARKLVIRKVYDMIPSNMENRKKRVFVNRIKAEGGHRQFNDYAEEFEYLTNSGIALAVQAVSNPRFPLLESENKTLLKLYMNDVGLLTSLLYGNNINAVLNDEVSINLGAVYETVVAQELHAHGFSLYYYDNKQRGEVDFLIDDFETLSVLPIEVKSGRDFTLHSALDKMVSISDYHIASAVVLSNEREVREEKGIVYMPIYYTMCFSPFHAEADTDVVIPEITL